MAVAFLLVGFAIGWFGHSCKVSAQSRSQKNTCTQQLQPAPFYEELQPNVSTESQKKTFELKENVAYGPIRPT